MVRSRLCGAAPSPRGFDPPAPPRRPVAFIPSGDACGCGRAPQRQDDLRVEPHPRLPGRVRPCDSLAAQPAIRGLFGGTHPAVDPDGASQRRRDRRRRRERRRAVRHPHSLCSNREKCVRGVCVYACTQPSLQSSYHSASLLHDFSAQPSAASRGGRSLRSACGAASSTSSRTSLGAPHWIEAHRGSLLRRPPMPPCVPCPTHRVIELDVSVGGRGNEVNLTVEASEIAEFERRRRKNSERHMVDNCAKQLATSLVEGEARVREKLLMGLRAVDIFSALNEEQLVTLRDGMMHAPFEVGQYVFEQARRARAVWGVCTCTRARRDLCGRKGRGSSMPWLRGLLGCPHHSWRRTKKVMRSTSSSKARRP
eukprot:6936132-Prymnesium_polylepis.2